MKRIITLLLSIIICFSFAVPAFAISNSTYIGDSDIQEQMLRILASVEEEKENYGLSTLDFSSIQLGSEIPAYKVSNDTLISADIRLIPITDGTKLLSIFYVADDESNNTFVQLSNELVDPLNNYISDPLALIYDDTGVYVYSDHDLNLLGLKEQSNFTISDTMEHNSIISSNEFASSLSISEPSDNKDLISSIDTSTLESVAISNCIAPIFTLNTALLPSTASAVTSKYLNVDVITQPSGTNICWAIAITSIANYIFNGAWDYNDIVFMFTAGMDKGQYTEQVIVNFNYWFNTQWGYSYTNTLSPSTILSYLTDGYPLYGDFSRTGGAHAVVIRGVNTSLKTFSVMNPTPSTTGYTSGTIASNNELTFVSGYSGSTYTLRSYGYPMYP